LLGPPGLLRRPAAQALLSLADGLRNFSVGLGEVKKFFDIASQSRRSRAGNMCASPN